MNQNSLEKLARERGGVSYGVNMAAIQGQNQHIAVFVPCAVVSEMNRREHWAVRRRRFNEQSEAVLAALAGVQASIVTPCTVRLTKIGHSRPDDDNLRSSFKAVRDAIASYAGTDDGDLGWRWEYHWQPKARKGRVGITIEIRKEAT